MHLQMAEVDVFTLLHIERIRTIFLYFVLVTMITTCVASLCFFKKFIMEAVIRMELLLLQKNLKGKMCKELDFFTISVFCKGGRRQRQVNGTPNQVLGG